MGTKIYAGTKDSNDLIYVVKEQPIFVFKELFPSYRVLNYEGFILDENKSNLGFIILDNSSFLGSTDSIDDLFSTFPFSNTNYNYDSLKNIYHKLISHTNNNNNFLEVSEYVGSVLGYSKNDVLKDFKDINKKKIDTSYIQDNADKLNSIKKPRRVSHFLPRRLK